MVEKDFLPPGGKIAFHLKDVQLMLDLAQRVDAHLVLSHLHAQALRAEVSKGRGEWDSSDIISFTLSMSAFYSFGDISCPVCCLGFFHTF